jgi:hypothetical protein
MPRLYAMWSDGSSAGIRIGGASAGSPVAAAAAARYCATVVATYCGPLSRPSILRAATPISASAGTASRPTRSLGDSRYAMSPRSQSRPSTSSWYGSRHACAHWPRLADRPPQASDDRHWPLHDTHSAPWMNTSSGSVVPAL